MSAKIGVLAVQGAFAAHRARLEQLGAATTAVRTTADLAGVDGLVMPGGESTTMSKLLAWGGLHDAVAARIAGGMPVFGTCAGLILLSRRVDPETDLDADQVRTFGALDVVVARNAYGRQIDSFEAELQLDASIAGDRDRPLRAVFIRAPAVEAVGPTVDVLATLEGRPVLVRQGSVMAAAFHPELTPDTRLHASFLTLVTDR